MADEAEALKEQQQVLRNLLGMFGELDKNRDRKISSTEMANSLLTKLRQPNAAYTEAQLRADVAEMARYDELEKKWEKAQNAPRGEAPSQDLINDYMNARNTVQDAKERVTDFLSVDIKQIAALQRQNTNLTSDTGIRAETAAEARRATKAAQEEQAAERKGTVATIAAALPPQLRNTPQGKAILNAMQSGALTPEAVAMMQKIYSADPNMKILMEARPTTKTNPEIPGLQAVVEGLQTQLKGYSQALPTTCELADVVSQQLRIKSIPLDACSKTER